MHYSAQKIKKSMPCMSEKWGVLYLTPKSRGYAYPPYPPHSTPMVKTHTHIHGLHKFAKCYAQSIIGRMIFSYKFSAFTYE